MLPFPHVPFPKQKHSWENFSRKKIKISFCKAISTSLIQFLIAILWKKKNHNLGEILKLYIQFLPLKNHGKTSQLSQNNVIFFPPNVQISPISKQCIFTKEDRMRSHTRMDMCVHTQSQCRIFILLFLAKNMLSKSIKWYSVT